MQAFYALPMCAGTASFRRRTALTNLIHSPVIQEEDWGHSWVAFMGNPFGILLLVLALIVNEAALVAPAAHDHQLLQATVQFGGAADSCNHAWHGLYHALAFRPASRTSTA